MSAPKVIGYAPAGKVETVAIEQDGEIAYVRRETHYTAKWVKAAGAVRADVDPRDILVKALEVDCRRWYHILARCPLPGEYVALKRSGQAARWFDTAYEKGVDQAPIRVTKVKDGVKIEHEAPRGRPPGVTAQELDWMDRMMDALLTLGFGSIGWVLVTGRAQRLPWSEMAARDLERRRERQLRNLYREALINLLPVWLERVHKI